MLAYKLAAQYGGDNAVCCLIHLMTLFCFQFQGYYLRDFNIPTICVLLTTGDPILQRLKVSN